MASLPSPPSEEAPHPLQQPGSPVLEETTTPSDTIMPILSISSVPSGQHLIPVPSEENMTPISMPLSAQHPPVSASASPEQSPPTAPLAPVHPGASAWDPLAAPEWDSSPPSVHCLNRIKRDLATIYREPPPGMFVVPDKEDMTRIHAMIIGPLDTPYEGGFFHFLVRCPPNYPINPPRVKLLTTGNNTVRFNPNFYKTGKVCLSILGTWAGPSWSPALSLSSLLISIQSLMTDKPYHNEPGYENERFGGDVKRYNLIIQHETLRVGVLENLERWPREGCSPFFLPATETIPSFINHFEEMCKEHMHRDGEDMRDPFGERRGEFQWKVLGEKLAMLRENNPQWFAEGDGENLGSEESELSDT